MLENEQGDTEEPRYYSQVTAEAMRQELDKARARIRQLDNLVGILNREADQQAATITDLREQVEHWRSCYMRACNPIEPEEK